MVQLFFNILPRLLWEPRTNDRAGPFFAPFYFSSEATPSPQLVSLLFHSEKEEGKRGRGACKKKKERGKEKKKIMVS